ncbi:hypothetical protein FRC08_006546 [Ceratobasidium sp. 394]|nr:hypothetical protein FRC08_006546 [Ceratobasidium sp. 394]KAG9080659.1 hypothetical protein FS749_007940 [Ceratobasidium sp. UAMH 11750]
MREGKTYRTLTVKATQNGRWIFQAVCSFQRPESNQPTHSWRMSKDIPPPNECPNQEDVLQRLAEKPDTRDEMRQALLAQVQEIKVFPIATKTAVSRQTADGLTEDIFWMRLRAMPTRDAPFQKVVLAFLSDLNILATVARAVHLTRGAAPPHRLAMISSLDHTVWFYDNDFDCTEWMLFVMVSPLVGMGRGIVHGRIYPQQGRLVAMIAQEGVVRAETGGYPKEQVVARL